MKYFMTIKVGYSKAQTGISGEYFTTIVTTKDGLRAFNWQGLFGADYRIAEPLKKKGYKESHRNGGDYGKLTRSEGNQWFMSETEAIILINKEF